VSDKAQRPLILLEFNELTPVLLDRFMAAGHLPNFKRFYSESSVLITDAEESGEQLNPWVQWVTVHSGLSYAEHGVLRLDEGQKLTRQCVWDVVSAQGKPVLVCGSMNVRYDKPLNGFVLPDPWSANVEPYPGNAGLDAYFRFVQTQVQEHTNDRVPLKARDYLGFLGFMIRHGLSLDTVVAIIQRLASERLNGGRGKWKRAVILDKLQFDVFRALYRRHRPAFSTFFLNSTAHMQHAYWRYMDPEPFKLKPTETERDAYGDAVLFGYREMDGILGRFMELAGNDATLVLSTGLSQQPYLDREDSGGKHFYRPKDFEQFLEFAGVRAPHRVAPVMSEEFHVYFDSEADAKDSERKIAALRVNGRPLMKVDRRDQTGVFAGAGIFDELDDHSILKAEDGRAVEFYDVFYSPDTVKSGKHHPDGALWIRTPEQRHSRFDGKVSLRAVAPTVLAQLGIPAPAYMSAPPIQLEGEQTSTWDWKVKAGGAPAAAAGRSR
jgi:hypothetical protein